MDIVAHFLPVSQCAICLCAFTPIHFLSITALGIGNESPVAPVFVGVWRRSLFVGYAQSGLQSGATMAAPQFINVGATEAIPLQSIKTAGDDTSDNVNIQTLDAFGRTVDTCNWNDWVAETACWVNDDFEEVTGVTFPAGQGLWVFGSSERQYLRFPALEL